MRLSVGQLKKIVLETISSRKITTLETARKVEYSEAEDWLRSVGDPDPAGMVDTAYMYLNVPPDEVEFGIGVRQAGRPALMIGGGLTGTLTHFYTPAGWKKLSSPIDLDL
jgi:hypothetical protein